HDHGDVAGALGDAGTAAFGAGHETLQDRALVDHDAGDLELVDVGAAVVLGVGSGRIDHLVDDRGRLLVAELQQVEGARDREAAHLVGDQAGLLRRDARRAEDCLGFHGHLPFFASAFLSPPWPLKVRVAANSPSLWPTMFSLTSTGTWTLPLWMAIVKPTISGRIIERRDQVLIGFLLPCDVSTFLRRWWSTNGPFLRERA